MVSGVMVRVLGVISRIFLILVLTHCPHALWSCSMARAHSRPPPEHSLSRRSETAGRVKKGLGFSCFFESPQRQQGFPAEKAAASAIARLEETCVRLGGR